MSRKSPSVPWNLYMLMQSSVERLHHILIYARIAMNMMPEEPGTRQFDPSYNHIFEKIRNLSVSTVLLHYHCHNIRKIRTTLVIDAMIKFLISLLKTFELLCRLQKI